jgi:hypothetical protein
MCYQQCDNAASIFVGFCWFIEINFPYIQFRNLYFFPIQQSEAMEERGLAGD